jgi:hypothetical protein
MASECHVIYTEPLEAREKMRVQEYCCLSDIENREQRSISGIY